MNDGNRKESDIKVYITSDYDMFKKMLGNRDVKGEAQIIESIQNVGYICTPITVNDKDEVIDGQNRLAALKELGLPVYYIVQPNADIKTCRALNIGQKNWGTLDYIESYAQSGEHSLSYKRLLSLINSYGKQCGIDGIMVMCLPTLIGNAGPRYTSIIRDDKLNITASQYELAVKRISSAISFGYDKFGRGQKMNGRIWWSCVSYIYQHPDVSAENVMSMLADQDGLIHTSNKVAEQLDFIDKIINEGKRPKEKVFLSSDFQKRLYLEGVE